MNRTIVSVLLALSLAAAPLSAQQTPEERLRNLEQRLDQLQRENEALRAEIDALRRDLGTPAATTTDAAPEEDLTKIDVAPAPAAPATAAAETPAVQPAPAPAETTPEPQIDVVQNAPNPGASKVFNPDISVIGNFIGKAGQQNPFEPRQSASLEESEISFQAFVDPYAEAKFFVAVGPEGAEVEEGYINFIALPHDFVARVGKLKAAFGKVNLMYTHLRPWVDTPLVLHNFFGDEGLSDSGLSVSRIIPNRANLFLEATGEIYSGNAEGVFEAQNDNDLFYLGHLKAFHDLNERSNLELGTSYARGTVPEVGGTNEFLGVDVTYRYKPLERAIYRSFISRTELIANRREGAGERAVGFYTSADYQFAQRWFAGVRLDRADHPDDPNLTDRGAALTLTFWPSEFSQLRAQARRVRYGNGPTVNELLLQVQFAIGAHGAHTF